MELVLLPLLIGGVLLLSFGGLALWVWMLVDAVQVPDGYFRSGTKTTWILVIALLGWIGALIYLFAGRPAPALRAWLSQMRRAGYRLDAPAWGAAPWQGGGPGAPPGWTPPPPTGWPPPQPPGPQGG